MSWGLMSEEKIYSRSKRNDKKPLDRWCNMQITDTPCSRAKLNHPTCRQSKMESSMSLLSKTVKGNNIGTLILASLTLLLMKYLNN